LKRLQKEGEDAIDLFEDNLKINPEFRKSVEAAEREMKQGKRTSLSQLKERGDARKALKKMAPAMRKIGRKRFLKGVREERDHR